MLLPSSSAAWLLSSDVMFKHASVCELAPLCRVTLHPGIEHSPTPSTSVLVQRQVACRNGDTCRSLGQAEVGEHGEEETLRCVRSHACVPNVPPVRNARAAACDRDGPFLISELCKVVLGSQTLLHEENGMYF